MWEDTIKYQPYRDHDEHIIETEDHYVRRMKSEVLPNWPEDVLKEWLYRHANQMKKYAFLGFETFCFSKENCPLIQVPCREAFDDEHFCDSFSNIEERTQYPHDWLAHYMLKEGTWNTPIILLRNQDRYKFPYGQALKRPFHLLEGHRRLSFLVGLRRIGKARPNHEIWFVSKQRVKLESNSAQ